MNCRDIEKLLAEGKPLTTEAQRHIQECVGCRSFFGTLAELEASADSVGSPDRWRETLTHLSVAKPLPSDPLLVSFTAGAFTVFCLVVAFVAGLQGFAHLTPPERLVYYTIVGLFGLLFSMVAVQSAIPGAKVRISGQLVASSSVVAIALGVTALFRNFTLGQFVHQGIPCLRLGCICAAMFGLLAVTALRRGYVTNVGPTSLLIGCFAGFSGVAVLSLKCPLQNVPHILVWHLGSMAVSAVVGAGIGVILERRR